MNDFLMQPKSTPRSTNPRHSDARPSEGGKPTERPAPSQEEIARRAYEIYVSKGSKPGRCRQNWLQAELELGMKGQAADGAEDCREDDSPGQCDGQESEMKLPSSIKSIKGNRASAVNMAAQKPNLGVYDNKA